MLEVNALAETLREQRLGALEATALLRKVMEEIDVAVFAFDDEQHLRPRQPRRASGCWAGPPSNSSAGARRSWASAIPWARPSRVRARPSQVLDLALPGGTGRFEVRGGTFRQGGLPHRLLVLANVSRALREEERQAWQRLIRVLGHELNNSLAPIKSIAGSLESLLAREPRPAGLGRGHAPRPGGDRRRARSRCRASWRPTRAWRACPRRSFSRSTWGRSCGAWRGSRRALEVARPGRPRDDDPRRPATSSSSSSSTCCATPPTRRSRPGAACASAGRGHGGAPLVEVWVEDEGPGLSNTANLFVPFFTTKPQGSGIGLVLCRQIAEAHGGALTLENRADRPGCLARLRLPR